MLEDKRDKKYIEFKLKNLTCTYFSVVGKLYKKKNRPAGMQMKSISKYIKCFVVVSKHGKIISIAFNELTVCHVKSLSS